MKKFNYPLLIASNNVGKVNEFKSILKDSFDKILSPADIGFEFKVEETGKIFYENALLKAEYAVKSLKDFAVLSDDSGLICNGLNGEPGIYSARYSQDGDNISLLLKKLQNIPDRTAYFECCLVLILPNGNILSAEGKTYGHITKEKHGTNGFGYDPVFYSNELKKVFGECSESEKNSVSHRGKALTCLSKKLSKYVLD